MNAIMAVAALLAENPAPTDEEIDDSITNICRCGTYNRIKAAIKHDFEVPDEEFKARQRLIVIRKELSR